MKKTKNDQAPVVQDATKDFELALGMTEQGNYVLRLYISGMTPNSRKAIENTKKICDEYLQGHYELEIIDIYQQPIFAKEGQIVAAPTLVKELPLPLRKFIGDMSQTERILVGLDLRTRSREELLAENKELRYRLEEAEETLDALGSGAADALVVSMPEGGGQVFTLQGAEHPYRVLIETMNEGSATLTSDGTILYCNKSMAALLQVPLEKLIGSVLLSYVAPADSALFAARLESGMREPEKGEISLLSGVGNPTPVLFSCCSVELPGSRGINVLFTDITELKQAETQLQIAAERERAAEELREHQERLALAADAGQIGMFDLNMESGDLQWTRQQEIIFGYEPTTTTTTTTTRTYRDWSDRVHPDDLPMVEERMRQAMEEKVPFQVEYRIVWPNGSVHWVNVTSKYYFDDSGRCTRLMGAVTDITESKVAEDLIRASLQEKEVLLKEIHHRVKNNMQVISSLVNLQADTINDPGVGEHLRDVRDRVRAMALVHEKLYQSENLSIVPFDEYVGSLLQYLSQVHRNTEATIKFTMDLQPVSLCIERAVPCGLMLNELVTNALKHAFRGRSEGEIATALHRNPDGTICLQVSDDGVGFPPEFDWRKSKSLGLRLVQMLAGQMGGTVQTGTDPGTEFRISFNINGIPL